MLSSVGQSNNVQRFSAVNAFRTNSAPAKAQETENNVLEEVSAATNVAPKGLLDRIDLNEIRECAKAVGEFNISDDDIKYGLMYGRSVIAEFLA